LHFKEEFINFVTLGMTDHGEIPSWDNWTIEKQMEKKRKHDAWLINEIGLPPYEYYWGGISSNYDPRSGSSTITVRYRRSNPIWTFINNIHTSFSQSFRRYAILLAIY
jgi:hypothetical protein